MHLKRGRYGVWAVFASALRRRALKIVLLRIRSRSSARKAFKPYMRVRDLDIELERISTRTLGLKEWLHTVRYPVLLNGIIRTPSLSPTFRFQSSIHFSSAASLFLIAVMPASSHSQNVATPITASSQA